MNNLNSRQAKYLGIALIALGVFTILRLWWLIPALVLAGAGIFVYMQRRGLGRVNEAVQFGLWGIGLALLTLVKLVFPGVLLLAGASLLLRGREQEIDNRVQALIARFGINRGSGTAITPTNPAASQATKISIVEEQPATGETTRLR